MVEQLGKVMKGGMANSSWLSACVHHDSSSASSKRRIGLGRTKIRAIGTIQLRADTVQYCEALM